MDNYNCGIFVLVNLWYSIIDKPIPRTLNGSFCRRLFLAMATQRSMLAMLPDEKKGVAKFQPLSPRLVEPEYQPKADLRTLPTLIPAVQLSNEHNAFKDDESLNYPEECYDTDSPEDEEDDANDEYDLDSDNDAPGYVTASVDESDIENISSLYTLDSNYLITISPTTPTIEALDEVDVVDDLDDTLSREKGRSIHSNGLSPEGATSSYVNGIWHCLTSSTTSNTRYSQVLGISQADAFYIWRDDTHSSGDDPRRPGVPG